MSASSGWPPGRLAGTNRPVFSTSRVLRIAWTPMRPRVCQVGPDGLPRALGYEEGHDRRARGVPRLLAQVEERIEGGVPSAPGRKGGLPGRKLDPERARARARAGHQWPLPPRAGKRRARSSPSPRDRGQTPRPTGSRLRRSARSPLLTDFRLTGSSHASTATTAPARHERGRSCRGVSGSPGLESLALQKY